MQPLTVGRRFEVNALVVLLAVWFGYGFWGIPGMLLAMPVVVALKVAAQYQPNMAHGARLPDAERLLAPEVAQAPAHPARIPAPREPAPGSNSVATRGG